MRKPVTVVALAALAGATVAMAGVFAAYWWQTWNQHEVLDLFAYEAPRRFVDYAPTAIDWASSLLPPALAGAIVGALYAAATCWLWQRESQRRPAEKERVR